MEEGQSCIISGDSNNVMKYKPIYGLPILSKFLELEVYKHLYAYLTYYKLLLDEQSSFRENRSFESILLKLTNFFLNNIDKGNLRDMVLVDPRKTFDLVDHELILFKLYLYGCRENELAWFRSYLTESYQCVIYDSVLSDPHPVNIGVPSGSILGPLLFIILMKHSILEIVDICFDMHADDSTLYTTGKCFADINRSLTTNSKPLYECVDGYCIVLNADKTECMILDTRKNCNVQTRISVYAATNMS